VCHWEGTRLLSAIGSCTKAVKAAQGEPETAQANAARPDCDAHPMAGNHDAGEKSQAGAAMKEGGDVGTAIEGIRPNAPRLSGRSRSLECLGSLTLGDALSALRPVLFTAVRACESIPAWLALRVAVVLVVEDDAHSDLLCQSLAFS
jgi:hypothetical protein